MVEDEPHVATALCQALKLLLGAGVSVECRDTAEAAERMLSCQCFDLLITDERLPGMTGLELLRKTKQLRPELPGILMTGYGTPEIEARTQALNCGYLAKPFGLAYFVQMVRDALTMGDC
jgi:DNA-binding NtrC family response regulator